MQEFQFLVGRGLEDEMHHEPVFGDRLAVAAFGGDLVQQLIALVLSSLSESLLLESARPSNS